ncbi:MAG: GNAT family N-acetyltransferase [Selenomonadaceae bacterium]|nr:GNAT family N-acetyltransferase [Selenomonadaceae bacterium]
MLNIFVALKEYLSQNGFKSLIYKCIPHIYHKYPCEEDRYALFINDAQLIRRDVSTSIFLPKKYSYNENCRRNIKKALKNKIEVRESDQYEKFIDLENEVLQEYHSATAVHSGEELRSLAEKFPQNIKLYIAELNGEMLAGTVVFINDHIVHTQYMANSNHGRKLGALDCLIDHLITNVFNDKIYFDFGISNEKEGRYLNQGLIRYKESYGARAVVHDFYRLNT